MALVTHLPLKVPKSCDLGRALTEHLQQRFHPRPVPPPALAFAREVHETRAQLERVARVFDDVLVQVRPVHLNGVAL